MYNPAHELDYPSESLVNFFAHIEDIQRTRTAVFICSDEKKVQGSWGPSVYEHEEMFDLFKIGRSQRQSTEN